MYISHIYIELMLFLHVCDVNTSDLVDSVVMRRQAHGYIVWYNGHIRECVIMVIEENVLYIGISRETSHESIISDETSHDLTLVE